MKRLAIIGNSAREHALALRLRHEQPELELVAVMDKPHAGLVSCCTAIELVQNLADAREVDLALRSYVLDLVCVFAPEVMESGVCTLLADRGVMTLGGNVDLIALLNRPDKLHQLLLRYGFSGRPMSCIARKEEDITRFLMTWEGRDIVIKSCVRHPNEHPITSGHQPHQVTRSEARDRAIQLLYRDGSVLIELYEPGMSFWMAGVADGASVAFLPMVQVMRDTSMTDSLYAASLNHRTYSLKGVSSTDELHAQEMLREVLAVVQVETQSRYRGIVTANFRATSDGTRLLSVSSGWSEPIVHNHLIQMDTALLTLVDAVIDQNLDTLEFMFREQASAAQYCDLAGHAIQLKSHVDVTVALNEVQLSQSGMRIWGDPTLVVTATAATAYEAGELLEQELNAMIAGQNHKKLLESAG